MFKKIAIYATMGLMALTSFGLKSEAAEDYVIGVSAGMTGFASGTYAPIVGAMRLFFDDVNAKGGINGHNVRLLVEDNQAKPSRAAAAAKKFVNNDDMILVINAALSSTYAPMIVTTKRAGMPLLFSGGVCPKAVYPPADRLQFCTTAYAAQNDSDWAIRYIRRKSSGAVKLGLVAMNIPISRGSVESAEKLSKKLGMNPVDMEIIPPPTPNYAPFATKLKNAGSEWVFSWAPWVTQVKTFEALNRQGWKGTYLAYAHINAEDEMLRIKDEKFLLFGANSFFQENLPIHRKIMKLAKKDNVSYSATLLAEGWIAALVLESVLENVSWPPSKEKVIAAMNNINVDLKGLRGGPIVWNENNHFRTQMHYRVYRWDNREQSVLTIGNWNSIDIN